MIEDDVILQFLLQMTAGLVQLRRAGTQSNAGPRYESGRGVHTVEDDEGFSRGTEKGEVEDSEPGVEKVSDLRS